MTRPNGRNGRNDYADCAARGLTVAETALALGVLRQAVYDATYKWGLRFRRDRGDGQKYADCAARGLTASEASRELGVSRQSVCMAAARHEIVFRRVTRSSVVTDELSPEQAADYRFLKRQGYRRDEALTAIGRADLTETPRAERN